MTDSSTTPTDDPVRAEVVYLYAFDVANEIRVERVAGRPSARRDAVRNECPAPRTVPVLPALALELPLPAAALGGRPVRAAVRVYAVGVVSVVAQVAVGDGLLGALRGFHDPVLDDGRPLEAFARDVRDRACRELADALVRPGPAGEPEAYTVFRLADLGGERDAARWLAARRRAVAGLLAATAPDRLSDAQVDEVLRLRRSYETTDLVVLDWDAALVVDLDGPTDDVLSTIELANLQLEEFRWIDRSLDRYLERAYAELGRRRPFFGRESGTLRSLRRLRVDLAKLADEVTHAGKLVGDWHLARVHQLARERFHLESWRASVADRLGQLDQLYTLDQGERYNRRMLVLEVLVVVLFVLDLLALVLSRS